MDIDYLKVPLHYMRRTLDRQVDGIDTIKATVRSVLGSASLIVSLVAALQILSPGVAPEWAWLYRMGIGLAAGLYVALIVACALALWPTTVFGPIKVDWDVLSTEYQMLNEEEIMSKDLSSLLNTIQLNTPIVNRYKRYQQIAVAILPVIVLMLLLLAALPRA
jgi:hypothetical protein